MRSPLILLSLLSCSLAAGRPDGIEAFRTAAMIRLDGRLDEEAWTKAPVAKGFTSQWPNFGAPATLPTEVKVLYDDRFLYVGARMQHPGDREGVVRRLHRRDQDSVSDWFGVVVDSLRDRQTAWSFMVNAGGIQRDVLHYADTNQDSSWDGVWESAVQVDEDGWTAELKIPLALMRIRKGDGPQTWGINFFRSDQGRFRERSAWSVAPRGTSGYVSLFPELRGIEGVMPQPRREWLPYLSLQKKVATAQPYDDLGFKPRVGLDLHMSVNTSAQFDATLRPDFGQVEVDEAVINLGTVETFFPEKRPFFLEGMELFQFPEAQLFYSRRIGKGLNAPSPRTGETLVDAPQAAEIQAAGKYTAKLSSGLNLAFLGANVASARVELDTPSGHIWRELAPMTNVGVARLQQRLDTRGSYVGGFATWMHQAGGRTATVTAADAVWKEPEQGFSGTLTAAHSETGTRGNQIEGHREYLRLDKAWRGGWSASLSSSNASRSYDPNDLGYLSRADQRTTAFSVSRMHDASWAIFRNWNWSLSHSQAWDTTGRRISRGVSGNLMTDTPWFWAIWTSAGVSLPAHEDRELRTFNAPVKSYLLTRRVPWINLGFDTAGNRPLYVRVSLNREWQEGGPSMDLSLTQNIKLGDATELQLSTASTHDEGERKFITSQAGVPITGLRHYSLFNQTVRISHAFGPRFTLQAFSQWLAGNWSYRDPKAYVDDDHLAPAQAPGKLAASTRLWNVNLIARWEFRPGSAAFVVYSHGANTDALINTRGTLSPRLDLPMVSALPSDDTVQVKVSWLFR